VDLPEEVLRGLLAAAPDGLLGVEPDGMIVFANEQVGRLFGWDARDLVGKPVEVLVPGDVVGVHAAHRSGYLADPVQRPMGAGLQLSGRRKDGSIFPADISLGAVEIGGGRTMVLAAVRDVSERLALEAERRRLEVAAAGEQTHRLESLGQLAGGVAHDFNNLLGVILNYVTLLSRQIHDPAHASDLGEIRAAAERGAALTRQLLAFARRDVANPEPLDVNDVVHGVGAMLGRTIGEHVSLRLELDDRPVVAMADRHQVEQIILNLALNARDALDAGGVLTIRTSIDGSSPPRASIVIADTGQGMPPEVVERAFEPFFTTKPRGQGTGLGLATVYGIVQQSHGEVALESRVGFGTSVAVWLPLADEMPARRYEQVEETRGGEERILLVEDEAPLRAATARLLRDGGYQVTTAGDGLEAIECLVADGFDLVVTDVAMPRMRGDELAERLRVSHPELPVLFMSGYDSGSTPTAGLVLPKPVDELTLLRNVREMLDG
jgi:two-component system cell cycle sensor histidine kinase/response regulator CckA